MCSKRKFLQRRYYSKEWLRLETPSRNEGVSYEEEEEYRQAYCQLIVDVGHKLELSMWAVGTAICYCHRFFAVKSMKKNDRFIIAQAALFLAFKVEEESKSLEKVISAFWEHRYRSRPGRPEDQLKVARQRLQDERFVEAYKQSVLTAERALLFALGFDLSPCQQHSMLVPLFYECRWAGPHADDEARALTQAAWNFMNDSLKTTVSLQATAEEIACAVMLLTARLFNKTQSLFRPDGRFIWEHRNISSDKLTGIIDEILQLYDLPHETAMAARGEVAPETVAGSDLIAKIVVEEVGPTSTVPGV